MVNEDLEKSMFNSHKELNHCKTEQDFHHYAYDENGELIFLQEGYIYDRKDYKCLACGEAMRPVMGEERVWHFRHKINNPQCSEETYLHRLAKALIKEESFFITYNIQETCPNIKNCPHRSEKCYSTKRHKIDLKEIYDTCEVEKTDGNSLYRADLKISSNKRSDTKPIFIEVDCTHDCTPGKIDSGIQIIELKINEEKDILKPLEETQMLFLDYENPNNPYHNCEKPVIGFYNFNRIEKKSQSDCPYLKAKRAIKRRFNKSETFPISYTVNNKCPLREKCNLATRECDHHIIINTTDLKKIYNRCDESKKGEIVLSNTDKEIAPLIFKFSFDGKTQYEPNRRIIEFGNFADVKKEIKDHERMHINFNNANPYDGYRLPSIRFYNFVRSEISPFSIQLKRFVIIKKGNELLAKLDNEFNKNCISEYEHPKDIIYELLFPYSYYNYDMLLFGIMKSKLKGIAIRNCFLCRHCHRNQNGCVRFGRYMADLLGNNKIDKFEESKKCPRYSCLDSNSLKYYITKNWGNIPCREWKNPYY